MSFTPDPNFEPTDEQIRASLNEMEAEFRQAFGHVSENEPLNSPGYYAARVEVALDQAEAEAMDMDSKGFSGEPTARMVVHQWRVEAFTELTKIAAHVMLQLGHQDRDYRDYDPEPDLDPEPEETPAVTPEA